MITAPKRNPHRLRFGAVVVLGASVVVAGCSGGSPTPSSSSSTGTTSAPSSVSATVIPPGTGTATGTSSYVVLGDSYSAGVGAGGSTDSCYRSQRGYAPLVAAHYGLQLSYQACSGATTQDVLTKQLGTLGAGTSRVSMTIGGNDVGFAFVLFTCGAPSWLSDCTGAIARGRTTLQTKLPGRLKSLFAQIRGRAPRAKVTIVGYPHLFGTRDCDALTFFSGPDRTDLNKAVDQLDALLTTTATSYGFDFVDPRSQFTGHTPCAAAPWINGLSFPVGDSYHPNFPGQQAYASLVGPALNATSSARAPQVTATATQPSVQAVAGAVLSMKLDQPAQLKAAQQAGVPTAELKKYLQQLRSQDTAQQAAGLAGLRALDRAAAARIR
ncbi:MAG: SGNH/GDSL hydrolase family protein [Actinomycetota bacterium]|nr:SGNH/GDSL hydrolase family protein [Actinomycetota bacterium]